MLRGILRVLREWLCESLMGDDEGLACRLEYDGFEG